MSKPGWIEAIETLRAERDRLREENDELRERLMALAIAPDVARKDALDVLYRKRTILAASPAQPEEPKCPTCGAKANAFGEYGTCPNEECDMDMAFRLSVAAPVEAAAGTKHVDFVRAEYEKLPAWKRGEIGVTTPTRVSASTPSAELLEAVRGVIKGIKIWHSPTCGCHYCESIHPHFAVLDRLMEVKG